MTKEENSYTKLLETENNVLKKQNAIYHNGFMEINLLSSHVVLYCYFMNLVPF